MLPCRPCTWDGTRLDSTMIICNTYNNSRKQCIVYSKMWYKFLMNRYIAFSEAIVPNLLNIGFIGLNKSFHDDIEIKCNTISYYNEHVK